MIQAERVTELVQVLKPGSSAAGGTSASRNPAHPSQPIRIARAMAAHFTPGVSRFSLLPGMLFGLLPQPAPERLRVSASAPPSAGFRLLWAGATLLAWAAFGALALHRSGVGVSRLSPPGAQPLPRSDERPDAALR